MHRFAPARTAGDSGRFAGTLATHCDRRWLQPGVDGLARGIGGGVDRDDLLRPGEPGAYEVESLPVWSERHNIRMPAQNNGLANGAGGGADRHDESLGESRAERAAHVNGPAVGRDHDAEVLAMAWSHPDRRERGVGRGDDRGNRPRRWSSRWG